jgi:hypothetical protein
MTLWQRSRLAVWLRLCTPTSPFWGNGLQEPSLTRVGVAPTTLGGGSLSESPAADHFFLMGQWSQ